MGRTIYITLKYKMSHWVNNIINEYFVMDRKRMRTIYKFIKIQVEKDNTIKIIK